jgi:hypothetical protein
MVVEREKFVVKCAQFKTSPLVTNQLFIIFILKSIKNDD